MGVVISSVVAGGPAVLEDLETPYNVILERRNRENEKKKNKPRLRRQANQIHFDASKTKTEEKKSKTSISTNIRSSSRASGAASRPQSRNSKPLKRQESVDQIPSPRKSEFLADEPNIASAPSLSVTEKIRLMLSTPREKKISENNDVITEEDKTKAANAVVEEVVGTMFQNVETIIKSDEGLTNIVEVETDTKENISSEIVERKSSKSSDQSSIKLSQKEKHEMIKQLPVARQEEYKLYAGQQPSVGNKNRQRKTSIKKLSGKISGKKD